MKKISTLLFFLTFICSGINSQSIVATSGGYFENGSISLSWTLGEPVTETLSSSSFILTQGFQQSKLSSIGLDKPTDDYEISLYPNPAKDFINIKTSKFESLSYKIYDINGKLLKEVKAVSEITQIPLNKLNTSIYFIKILDNKKTIEAHKIVKQ